MSGQPTSVAGCGALVSITAHSDGELRFAVDASWTDAAGYLQVGDRTGCPEPLNFDANCDEGE